MSMAQSLPTTRFPILAMPASVTAPITDDTQHCNDVITVSVSG